MASHTFFCIDSHTCGCPVRVVAGGAPPLKGATASERRVDFVERYDWIETFKIQYKLGIDGAIFIPATLPPHSSLHALPSSNKHAVRTGILR